MPKVALIPKDKTKEQMLRCLDSKLAYYGMRKKDLAEILNVEPKTITNRYYRPGLFTLQELLQICKILKMEIVITDAGIDCR